MGGPTGDTEHRIRIGRGSQASVPERLGIGFWLSLFWVLAVLACALLADLLPLHAPDAMDWKHVAAPPGPRVHRPMTAGEREARSVPIVHVLGTDTLGRDILSRLIFGARISLAVGIVSPLIGLVIGGILGMLAGFYRGPAEAVLMTFMDVILAFPGLVLLLAVTYCLGPALKNMVLALGILSVPAFARVARAKTLAYSRREFVTSARAIGQKELHILFVEIFPNILLSLMVYALLIVSYMIVAEGALSFLGLAVPPPTPSWGGMIADGREVLHEAAHVSMIPSLILFLTVLSFNLMGDALRSLIDAREGRI